MKQVSKFESIDGKIFDDETSCLAHEIKYAEIAREKVSNEEFKNLVRTKLLRSFRYNDDLHRIYAFENKSQMIDMLSFLKNHEKAVSNCAIENQIKEFYLCDGEINNYVFAKNNKLICVVCTNSADYQPDFLTPISEVRCRVEDLIEEAEIELDNLQEVEKIFCLNT
jgi:hypothetical protein